MKKGGKICVLGAGNVGSTIAFTLTLRGLASEIVLIDINKDKADGEVMDIIQGTSFSVPVNLHSGEYKDAAGSDIVIVTLGAGRKPGQTRIELAKSNVETITQVIPKIVEFAPEAVYVVVSNPVDIITYVITKISGLPPSRVIGSGTLLDTARLNSALAARLGLCVKDIKAFVLGEHGDTAVIPWSMASIAGINIGNYEKEKSEKALTKEDFIAIEEEVRKAGASVIARKGATYYAIALSVQRICEALLLDTESVLTVSNLIDGQYGITDICLSLPFVVGAQGIKRCLEPPLSEGERELLLKSAKALSDVRDQFDIRAAAVV